jgi:hypothetical protein
MDSEELDTMSFLDTEWFKLCKEASDKGRGKIFGFGLRSIKEEQKKFMSDGFHKLEYFDFNFRPNPFQHQYDLLMHMWLNYYKLLKREIQLLKNEGNDRWEELQEERTFHGITRQDLWFAAAQLRWPSVLDEDGGWRGLVIRDPWADDRIRAVSAEQEKYVMTFGGGGQGKTLVFSAFHVTIFDHFIRTRKGARCLFSTTAKDKIESATWPYLQDLINGTQEGLSLYAGLGRISGNYTIRRPDTKDTGGVIKGILISNEKNDKAVHKLTGAHGHDFVTYLIDEIQSTPIAPIKASSNFTMKCGDYRVMGAGNYDKDDDSLGKNVVPHKGWDSTTPETHEWRSTTANGQRAIVLHFNNELSPGMTPEGAKLFPHLPNRSILTEKYKPEARTVATKEYALFWMGWRQENVDGDTILTQTMVTKNMADRPLNLSKINHDFLSFDSAQAEGDRNLLGHFQDGVDVDLEERVWGLHYLEQKQKSAEGLQYYRDSTNWIYGYAKKMKIKSGDLIVDWTGRPAQAEMLKEMEFMSHQLVYNMGVPDGKRTSPVTKRVERPIIIYEGFDESGNVDVRRRVYAHQVADNMISLGAYFLQEYVKSGRVRGMNRAMMNFLSSSHSIEEEMFSRKFKKKVSKLYGDLLQLVSKDEFKEDFGFSPDLMDIWFQAAFYMFMVRKMPLSPINGTDQNIVFNPEDTSVLMDDHNNIWKGDSLETYGYDGVLSDY